METLFVISPIGLEGSETRAGADIILEVINRANELLDGRYDVIRGDQDSGDRIADAIFHRLDRAPMVIAYFGGGAANPNVMLEVGYRMALDKPLLLLAHKETDIPFDLVDFRRRIIAAPAALEKRVTFEDAARKVAESLRQLIKPPRRLESGYPAAELRIDLFPEHTPEERAENSIFVSSSLAAEEFFHVDVLFGPGSTLIGKPIYKVFEKLEPLCDPTQWRKVQEEQDGLRFQLLQGNPRPAKRPLRFRDGPSAEEVGVLKKYRACSFLPLIVQHQRARSDREDTLTLRMLYFRVPNGLSDDPDGTVRCDPEALIGLTKAIDDAKSPAMS